MDSNPARARTAPRRWFAAGSGVLATALLAGCPPTGKVAPGKPLSITVSSVTFASPNGGIAFRLAGQGFTPGGEVRILLFNVPGTTGPLIKADGNQLVADASGAFANFPVSADCPDPTVNYPPSDIFLWGVDLGTERFDVHEFSTMAFCTSGLNGPPSEGGCPMGTTDPRCNK